MARSLPSGLPWVIAVDGRALLESSRGVRLLERPGTKAALETVRDSVGIDFAEAETAVAGFQVLDGTLQFILVLRLPVDGDKLAASLASFPDFEARTVAGRPMRALLVGKPFDHFLTPGDLTGPPSPPRLPILPDVVVGATSGHELLIGTEHLVQRYLEGDEQLGADAEMARRIAEVATDSVAWALFRGRAVDAEAQFVRDLIAPKQTSPVRPGGSADAETVPDYVCLFEVQLEDDSLVGRFSYRLASEADATRFATLWKDPTTYLRLPAALKLTSQLSQDGASVTVSFRMSDAG